jgi:hypothetical protein
MLNILFLPLDGPFLKNPSPILMHPILNKAFLVPKGQETSVEKKSRLFTTRHNGRARAEAQCKVYW